MLIIYKIAKIFKINKDNLINNLYDKLVDKLNGNFVEKLYMGILYFVLGLSLLDLFYFLITWLF